MEGDYAYVACEDELRLIDVSDATQPEQVAVIDYPRVERKAESGPGLAFAVSEGRGLEVFDVRQPTSPALVSQLVSPGPAHDMDEEGGYVYLALGYLGELVVLDARDATAIEHVGTYNQSNSTLNVAVADGYAYVCGGASGFLVLEISDPSEPEQVGVIDTRFYSDDLALEADHAYVADHDGVRIIDISDPYLPFEVGLYDLVSGADAVEVRGGLAFVAADWRGLRVVDVTQPSVPTEVGHSLSPTSARDVALRGHYAYVANYHTGLRILDIQDPRSPVEVGAYDTADEAWGVVVVDDLAYIATNSTVVEVIDVTDPANPIGIERMTMPSHVDSILAVDDLVYVAQESTGVDVVAICGIVFADGFEAGDLSAWSGHQREVNFYGLPAAPGGGITAPGLSCSSVIVGRAGFTKAQPSARVMSRNRGEATCFNRLASTLKRVVDLTSATQSGTRPRDTALRLLSKGRVNKPSST